MARDEQVLVVERKVVEQVGMFHSLQFDIDRYLDKLFVSGVPRFTPRSRAEKDPAHKQLIPYLKMAYDCKYLSCVRRAGCLRLCRWSDPGAIPAQQITRSARALEDSWRAATLYLNV